MDPKKNHKILSWFKGYLEPSPIETKKDDYIFPVDLIKEVEMKIVTYKPVGIPAIDWFIHYIEGTGRTKNISPRYLKNINKIVDLDILYIGEEGYKFAMQNNLFNKVISSNWMADVSAKEREMWVVPYILGSFYYAGTGKLKKSKEGKCEFKFAFYIDDWYSFHDGYIIPYWSIFSFATKVTVQAREFRTFGYDYFTYDPEKGKIK